jgi:hypothetical protein
MEQLHVIRRKLTNLAGYAAELEPFREYTFDQYASKRKHS